MLVMSPYCSTSCFFFFNDTATTEIYTLSLHDALPICSRRPRRTSRLPLLPVPAASPSRAPWCARSGVCAPGAAGRLRSEEHTSELQSRLHLVCRLLLEKKNTAASRAHARAVVRT